MAVNDRPNVADLPILVVARSS